jgi:hypothetical protein
LNLRLTLHNSGVFEAPMAPGHVSSFVNFPDFSPHKPEVRNLVSLFWKQLDWIQPESYIAADGSCARTPLAATITAAPISKNRFIENPQPSVNNACTK